MKTEHEQVYPSDTDYVESEMSQCLIDSSISEFGAQSSDHLIIQNVFKSILKFPQSLTIPNLFNVKHLSLI